MRNLGRLLTGSTLGFCSTVSLKQTRAREVDLCRKEFPVDNESDGLRREVQLHEARRPRRNCAAQYSCSESTSLGRTHTARSHLVNRGLAFGVLFSRGYRIKPKVC